MLMYGMVWYAYLSLFLRFFIAYAYIALSIYTRYGIGIQSGNEDQITDPALAAYDVPFGEIWFVSRGMEFLVWAESVL